MTARHTPLTWTTKSLTGRMAQIQWQRPSGWTHVDPYLAWFDLTGFRGALLPTGKRSVRVLTEQRSPTGNRRLAKSEVFAAEKLRALCARARRSPDRFRFELSLAWATPDRNPRSGAPARRRAASEDFKIPSTRCVIGIIDVGCAFANRKFRIWAAGEPTLRTRIAALWDQGEVGATKSLSWAVPQSFAYGAEVRGEDLDKLMARHELAGVIDERACYRESGHAPLARHATHGTHIMDLAAGYPSPLHWAKSLRPRQPPAEADIIFVSLPRTVRGASVGGLLRAQVLDALRYIVSRSPDDAEKIVVNLSYGAYAGGHDGGSIIEKAIDQLISDQRGRLSVVVAAGNAGNRQLHAVAKVEAKASATFRWNVLPGDPTDSFVELWFGGADEDVVIRVTPPGVQHAPENGWVCPGSVGAWTRDGEVVSMLGIPLRACQGKRRMALLAARPSRGSAGGPSAPYGAWAIEVRNLSKSVVDVDAWCERDDPAFGSVLWPRQSYFSATGSTRIDDRNTLSSLAHGSKTKVVRGRLPKGRAALEKRHSVTSEGDSRDGRREVDVVAPTDESAARPGVAGAAVISGQSIRLGGTSVAAAFTTRDICEGRVGRPDAFEKWDPHASPKTKGRRPTYLD